MKIAIFSDCYLDLTGGIVQVINAQKTALEQQGHVVEIFSTGFQRPEAELRKLAAQNIFVVPSCKLFFKGLTPVSRRPGVIEKWLLKEHPEIRDFDVIYVHYEGGCSIAGLRLARRLGVPSVQMMHGREDMGVSTIVPKGLRTVAAGLLNWFHAWYLPHPVKVRKDNYLANTVAKARMWTLMVNHANYADVVVTPSEHFRKKLVHYGISRPVKVVPNGYPDAKFPSKVQVKGLASGETLRMIWHSRVQGEKRIMPFLEALRLLGDKIDSDDGNGKKNVNCDKNSDKKSMNSGEKRPKFTLDVYGGGTELKRARKYAKRYALPVKFYGDVKFDVVQKAILAADLDVMASYNYDTFGMTLIEAEANGTPVFFCDPDMREIVPKGGYVLAAGLEPMEMAAALSDLIAHPERIRKMSQVMVKKRGEVVESKRIEKLEQIFRSLQS